MRRLLLRAMAATPGINRGGLPHDAALREKTVAALLRLAEQISRDGADYRRRCCDLIALHVLIRESRRDPRLRSAPALFMERAFAASFDAIDRADDDWMLTSADERLIDAGAAGEARAQALREFPRLYARFHACVAELAAGAQRSFDGPTPRVEGPLRVGYVDGATFPRGEPMPAEEAPQIRVVWPQETHDARAAFDQGLSVGAGVAAFDQLAGCCEWTSPAVTSAEFADARLHAPTGLLFTQNHLWCDASFATVLNAGGRSRALEFAAADDCFFRVSARDEEAPLRLDRPAMVLSFWASRINYGHWLANSLLSVYLALDPIRSGELKLVTAPLTPRQRAEVLALGAPEGALIETAQSFVRGPLVYPSALSTSTNMSPGSWAPPFFAFLRERLGVAGESRGPRFVYLSRRNLAGSSRVMSNEGALIRRLSELGFACVDPQDLDLAAQARLMSRAQIVVGQFGAALWNLGFAPPGGVAIEISVEAYASNEYLYLATLMGLRFVRVMARADVAAAEAARGSAFSFTAPVEDVVSIVRSLMAGR